MSIKKWKGNRYRLDLKIRKDGEVFRLTKVVDSVKEAKQLEAEFRFKIDNELTVSKLTPFNIYGQQYIDNLIGISARTKHTYQQKFNYLKDMTRPINKYRNTDIRKMMKDFTEQGLSPRSVRHIHSIMKRIFSQACLDFQIHQPCGTFKQDTQLKVNANKKNRALTIDEQNRFLNYLAEHKHKKYFTYQEYIFGLMAYSTGMRRGELSALEWTDFDFENSKLSITKAVSYVTGKSEISTPKTEAGNRIIQLDNFLVSEIKKYKSYLTEWYNSGKTWNEKVTFDKGWFFPYLNCPYMNTPITSWSQRMQKVFKACDIDNSLHGLRHTHASNLLMSDYPTIQLAHRLGHADAKITMGIYAHYIPETAVDIHQYIPKVDITNGSNS
jgi:integrase